jgi:hypothetical protein
VGSVLAQLVGRRRMLRYVDRVGFAERHAVPRSSPDHHTAVAILAPGTRVGPYEVVSALGAGGRDSPGEERRGYSRFCDWQDRFR